MDQRQYSKFIDTLAKCVEVIKHLLEIKNGRIEKKLIFYLFIYFKKKKKKGKQFFSFLFLKRQIKRDKQNIKQILLDKIIQNIIFIM